MSFFVFFCHVIIGLGHFGTKWPPFSHGADHRRSFVQIASTHHLNGGITNDDHQLERVFYWYKTDEYIEVTDEVAEELRADKRYEVTHHRRMKRNKANYSLDADDGIEYAACEFEPSPEKALDLMEQYRRLCCALNHLPPVQGQRIDAHYLLGWSIREIALAENVSCRAVQISIDRGLRAMRKFF